MLRKTTVFMVFSLFLFSGFRTCLAQEPALSINDCIQIALKNNPDLKNAQRQINLAGTGVTIARANFMPSFDLSFSSSRTFQAEQGPYLQDVPVLENGQVVGFKQKETFRDSYYRNFYNNGVSISQNIFRGGRMWNQMKQANADYNSAKHGFASTREQVIATVTQDYYNLLKSIRLQEVYEKAVESSQEQLKKTQSMYEVGAVAQADVYKAQVSLGEQQINLIQQKNTVDFNRSSLNIVMGRNPTQPLQIIGEDLDIEQVKQDVSQLWAIAEQSNPELKSLQSTVNSDEYGIKMAKSTFLPQISFSASYGRGQSSFDLLYSPFDKNYQLSGRVSVSWNLFNGFADDAQIERESINYYIDKERFTKRQLEIRSEIEQTYLNMKAYQDIEKINEENLKSAEEDLRLNQERYRIGSGTLLEVIDAQVSLTRAQATLITTKYNKYIELVNLYGKIGILEEKMKPLMK